MNSEGKERVIYKLVRMDSMMKLEKSDQFIMLEDNRSMVIIKGRVFFTAYEQPLMMFNRLGYECEFVQIDKYNKGEIAYGRLYRTNNS